MVEDKWDAAIGRWWFIELNSRYWATLTVDLLLARHAQFHRQARSQPGTLGPSQCFASVDAHGGDTPLMLRPRVFCRRYPTKPIQHAFAGPYTGKASRRVPALLK